MKEQLIFDNGEVEKKERPKFVYHSSHNSEIEELSPRQERERDSGEGPVIFATPDKGLASAFLVKGHNDSWMKISYYNDVLVVTICANREKFIKNDKGGTLYILASDNFNFDPNRGMGEREWTSHVPAKPINKTKYNSALDAMIENGARVYFIDKKSFEEIKKSDDHGYTILLSKTSENEHRGENIKSLEDAVEN